jgi:hypothetical protein
MSERASEATVSEIEEVPNTWDGGGPAYKITLSCGHHLFATAAKIFNISSIDCRYCGGNGTIRYHS